MHGKLALYHPQYGVIPIAVSLLAIIWTTVFLTWLRIYLVADDVEDDQGKPIVSPAGKDSVVIIDVANPESPKMIRSARNEQ
jgi:hypothetical protein